MPIVGMRTAPAPRRDGIGIGPEADTCRAGRALRLGEHRIGRAEVVLPRQAMAHERLVHVGAGDEDAPEQAIVAVRSVYFNGHLPAEHQVRGEPFRSRGPWLLRLRTVDADESHAD